MKKHLKYLMYMPLVAILIISAIDRKGDYLIYQQIILGVTVIMAIVLGNTKIFKL